MLRAPNKDGMKADEPARVTVARKPLGNNLWFKNGQLAGTMTECRDIGGIWYEKDTNKKKIRYDINGERMPGYSHSVISSEDGDVFRIPAEPPKEANLSHEERKPSLPGFET